MKGIEEKMKIEREKIDVETAYRCLKNYILSRQKVDFVDVENLFNIIGFRFKGKIKLQPSKNQSVLIWDEWNKDAIEVLKKLLSDGFTLERIAAIHYNFFKCYISKLPVASSAHEQYDEMHWLPMVIKPGKNNAN